jgi:hypothetical protein
LTPFFDAFLDSAKNVINLLFFVPAIRYGCSAFGGSNASHNDQAKRHHQHHDHNFA